MKYVFVESIEFTRRIVRMKLEKELRALQTELSANPQKGRLDPGACGLRKVRMNDAGRNQGKSYGARVHYLFLPHRYTLYLVNVYGKDDQDGLSPQQKKELCEKIRPLKAQ